MGIRHGLIGEEPLIVPRLCLIFGWNPGHMLQSVPVSGASGSRLWCLLIFCYVVSIIPSSVATGWLSSDTENFTAWEAST